MLRFGNISEVDPVNGYARVKFLDDGIVSAPLQLLTRTALVDKDNFTFDTNEQVACLMDENSEQGVILGATFNNKTKPGSGGGPGIYKMLFGDDSFTEYNRNTHELNVNIQGDINIISTGTAIVEAETADITATTVNVDATVVNVDAESVNVDASSISMAGAVDITGAVSITGEVTITGGLTVSAAITALTVAATASISAPSISGPGVSMSGGNLAASGDVSAGGISLSTHKHPGVTAGVAQTGTPV